MAGLLSRIMPREQSFFTRFIKVAETVHAAARALVKMRENYSSPTEQAERIKDLELRPTRLPTT